MDDTLAKTLKKTERHCENTVFLTLQKNYNRKTEVINIRNEAFNASYKPIKNF